MNILKKLFNRNKFEEKFGTSKFDLNKFNINKSDLKKKGKIFLKILLGVFLGIFILFSIFIYSFLGDFKKFFFNIPSLTGFFGEKNYLILMLNNSEIRPGGGFISSFAEVNFFMGMPDIKIKNSYNIGNPQPLLQPPYPYSKLLSKDIKNYKGRVFRDANLSPDFKTNVGKIIEIYNKSNKKIEPENIDGVFSIDMNFLKSLLQISGEVVVDGKTFNANNFFYQTQILSKDVDLHSIEDLNSRKSFLKPLIEKISQTIVKKIIYGNLETLELFLNEIKNLASTKHIQMFLSKDNLQEKIEESGWDGNFSPKGEDYISVNISNIGGRKADRYIRKNYFYDIDFTGKDAIGELKITAKHLGTKSLISGFYQGYYKIFLPKGITILNKNELEGQFNDKIKIDFELNSTTIGGIVHFNLGEEKIFKIKYKLPKIINSKNYNLHLITQAGGNGESWNVSVKEKTDIFWEQPLKQEFQIKENLAFFEKTIFKDKTLNLKNIGDKVQPIITWQQFIDKNTVEINFSEPISEKILNDEKNFFIIERKTKSKIVISKKYIKGNNLYLELENDKYKKGTFYELMLMNAKDLSGNFTSQNPKKITIVQ